MRRKSQAQHVVEEKVMQLIGADQILGLLGDRPVRRRRQKLRGNRGVQHVHQDACFHLVAAVIRDIVD